MKCLLVLTTAASLSVTVARPRHFDNSISQGRNSLSLAFGIKSPAPSGAISVQRSQSDARSPFVLAPFKAFSGNNESSESDRDIRGPWPTPSKGFNWEAFFEFVIPVSAPFWAYHSYDEVAGSYEKLMDLMANNNWVAVDGGAFQAKIIAPALNGVVLPAIALLYATLTSTTVSTLRQRQLDVRRAINMEAGQLRAFQCILDGLPDGGDGPDEPSIRALMRDVLIRYISRVIRECQTTNWVTLDLAVSDTRVMESEINDVLKLLNEHYDSMPIQVADAAYQSVATLREQRHVRLSALQSTYPKLHYVLLGVLALANCTGFLMMTNQELMLYLSSTQLKILWSALVSTYVACFSVFYDLTSPFSGSYQISSSVEQLHKIRDELSKVETLEE